MSADMLAAFGGPPDLPKRKDGAQSTFLSVSQRVLIRTGMASDGTGAIWASCSIA